MSNSDRDTRRGYNRIVKRCLAEIDAALDAPASTWDRLMMVRAARERMNAVLAARDHRTRGASRDE